MLKDPEGDQAFPLSHLFAYSPTFLLPTLHPACGPPTDGNAEMNWPQAEMDKASQGARFPCGLGYKESKHLEGGRTTHIQAPRALGMDSFPLNITADSQFLHPFGCCLGVGRFAPAAPRSLLI